VKAASQLDAKVIIVLSTTGVTARLVARYRPNATVVAFVEDRKVGRQLNLVRGVHPLAASLEDVPMEDREAHAISVAKQVEYCSTGDYVVLLSSLHRAAGVGEEETPTMKILRV
jgi:pyruvate kinase